MTEVRGTNEQLLKRLGQYVEMNAHDDTINKGIRGAICGILDSIMGDKIGRYALLHTLFPETWELAEDVSTKTLSGAQWFALWQWVKPWKNEDIQSGSKWVGHPLLKNECAQLMGSLWFNPEPEQGLSTDQDVNQDTLPGMPSASDEIRDLGY